MNREIKFRALDLIYNKWVYSNGYYFDGINYWFVIPNAKNAAIAFSKNVQVLQESIFNYTGLHDKNGIEIYEGDRVSHNGSYGIIIFEAGAFMIDFGDLSRLLYGLHIDCVVTGNTHETQELMETSK